MGGIAIDSAGKGARQLRRERKEAVSLFRPTKEKNRTRTTQEKRRSISKLSEKHRIKSVQKVKPNLSLRYDSWGKEG